VSKSKSPAIPAASDDGAASRRGPRDTRGVLADRVLAAARSLFATRGYASTSLRNVAELADVDVALVSYYFKNKAGLLDAAVTLPETFGAGVEQAVAAPVDQRGHALVAAHLAAWEDEPTADILRAAILAAANEPAAMDRVRTIYTARFLDVVMIGLPEDERRIRAGLVASQLLGLAMTRYVWRVGALAEMSPEEISKLMSPVIQRLLTEPLYE
jgi:AcrR family transcriptional regulator